MTNGSEGLSHCNILAETIAFNLWKKYKNNTDFFIYFRKIVLSNISENSIVLLNNYNQNLPNEKKSSLKIIFKKDKNELEDTFNINKNIEEENIDDIIETNLCID